MGGLSKRGKVGQIPSRFSRWSFKFNLTRQLDEVFSLVFIREQRLHFGAQAVVVAARLRHMGSP